MTVRITKEGYDAIVAFPWDPDGLNIIRGVPTRRFNPDRKVWIIDISQVQHAIKAFQRGGFQVLAEDVFDPKNQPPPRHARNNAGAEDPFAALFAALPEALRDKVYTNLAKALHPDVGGNTQLMQQLNRAFGR